MYPSLRRFPFFPTPHIHTSLDFLPSDALVHLFVADTDPQPKNHARDRVGHVAWRARAAVCRLVAVDGAHRGRDGSGAASVDKVKCNVQFCVLKSEGNRGRA